MYKCDSYMQRCTVVTMDGTFEAAKNAGGPINQIFIINVIVEEGEWKTIN